MGHNQKNKVQYSILNRICVMCLLVALYSVTIETLLPFHPKEVIAQGFGQDNSGGGFGGSDYITYTDNSYGFSLTFPSDWEQAYESDMCASQNCNYIVSFQNNKGAALRIFFYDVGNIATNTYNNDYYDFVSQLPQTEIFFAEEITIGGVLPGGMMAYTSPASDATGDILGFFESWGKYGNLGYLHFKLVTNDPNTLAREDGEIGASIIGSFTMTTPGSEIEKDQILQ
jgi:hypothetical protein